MPNITWLKKFFFKNLYILNVHFIIVLTFFNKVKTKPLYISVKHSESVNELLLRYKLFFQICKLSALQFLNFKIPDMINYNMVLYKHIQYKKVVIDGGSAIISNTFAVPNGFYWQAVTLPSI